MPTLLRFNSILSNATLPLPRHQRRISLSLLRRAIVSRAGIKAAELAGSLAGFTDYRAFVLGSGRVGRRAADEVWRRTLHNRRFEDG
jgi:hypothetical protein